jgi:hypothetical protein
VSTTDYSYDLSNWDLVVVLESTYSTDLAREGVIEFSLELRNICWDLPYTDFNVPTGVPQIYPLWVSHQIHHAYMLMISPWGDYCGGSTYTLEYVSGPKLGDPAGHDIM